VRAVAVLLSYAVLSIWIEGRWAWGLAQLAVFAGIAVWAAGQLRRPSAVRGSWWLAPLCAAPLWGLLQLATYRTVYRWATWNATLTWATWLALFSWRCRCSNNRRRGAGFCDSRCISDSV